MYILQKIDLMTCRIVGIMFESHSFEEERILKTLMESIKNGEIITITDKSGNFVSEFIFSDREQEK